MKYIKRFNDVADANAQGAVGLASHHISGYRNLNTINIYKTSTPVFTCTFDETGKIVVGFILGSSKLGINKL